MGGTYDDVTMGIHRLNALLSWWSVPNADGHRDIDAQISRLERFSSQLQQACGDTCSRQVDAAHAASDQFAHAFQDLARCRGTQEVIAAEAAILETLIEVASSQAKIWIELMQKLQQSYVTMARETTEDILRRAPATPPASLRVDTERRATPPVAERAYA